MSITVNEIFHSIQGESSYSGSPCVFVRLTGCNMRCSYCDTQYAYTEGQEKSIGEILDQVHSYNCKLVEITGGEPLIQKETPALISELLRHDYKVLLETNGSQDISMVDDRCVKIVDMKCPSSGESKKNDLANLSRLCDHDELKFVISDREDFIWATSILKMVPGYPEKNRNIFFSTVFDTLAPSTLADWILKENIDVRLQLQLHKYIWDPNLKGV